MSGQWLEIQQERDEENWYNPVSGEVRRKSDNRFVCMIKPQVLVPGSTFSEFVHPEMKMFMVIKLFK